MLVYRIVKAKYASNLNVASGMRNRWNDDGQFVIYTATSRSLACLENLVHRSHSGLNHLFKTMVIKVPDILKLSVIPLDQLPNDWRKGFCSVCYDLGRRWYIEGETAILQVPSSIVPQEHNLILNIHHPEFKQVKLEHIEDFLFDKRL
ncbi:MAG: RES family NAD+ phosphorylase [Candidatus Cyclobacteriaceae bacterium M3_2C_046]